MARMFAVDVGGTFTDVVGIRQSAPVIAKVPTRTDDTAAGVLEGAAVVGVADMGAFNHASTIGLNAVLTRRLPKIGFLTTDGHRDILDMGRGWRPLPALTDANWRRSFSDGARPIVPRYLRRGVWERISSTGEELLAIDEQQARSELRRFRRCGIEGVAICLINSYANGEHEVRVRDLVAEELGDIPCAISSEVSPLAKEFARASTTVIDVIMRIIYSDYSGRLQDGLRDLGFKGEVNFADCAAQLIDADTAMTRAFRIVSSGPAAGTVSSAYFGKKIEDEHLICCDVGGTSCDISVVTNSRPYLNTTFELEHDLIVNALSNEISTLSAGGGSIVSVDAAGQIQVGPASAGSTPGPACYGKGGEAPTMTDACLLIGILSPTSFLGGKMQLRPELAERAFQRLACSLSFARRVGYAYRLGLNHIAEGLVDITVKHGIDPRDYSLIAYGAAGPMLVPGVLDLVRARRVIVPPYPGLFSALGLLSADLVYSESRTVYRVLTPDFALELQQIYDDMEAKLRAQVDAPGDARVIRSFDARLLGQTWETPFVELPDGPITEPTIKELIDRFHKVYAARSGESFPELPVQGVTYRVQLVIPTEKVKYAPLNPDAKPAVPIGETMLRYLTKEPTRVPVYDRGELAPGQVIEGPAVIRESLSTTHVGDGQVMGVGHLGELVIERSVGASQ